jgi:lipopolysaccharide transport system permease protein
MSSSTQTVRIRPPSRWSPIDFQELWQYRELLHVLVVRGIAARYQQSILGVGWFALQPLITALIYSVVFGVFARLPSEGVPYPLFFLTALLPWSFFSTALTGSVNSLVTSSNLVKKVYFPRMLLPTASVLTALIDFLAAAVILLALMVYFGRAPTAAAVLLPLLLVIPLLLALGLGFWFSALHVQYRDVAPTVQFITRSWMFLSPVIYPTSLVPEHLKPFYYLNPMAGVIDGFRWALLGTSPPPWPYLWLSVVLVSLVLISGAFFFRSRETTFADVV